MASKYHHQRAPAIVEAAAASERERRMSGVDEEKKSHPAVSIPRWWEEAADSVAFDPSSPIAVVCGPGNTGKSTFSRLLLNTLLKRYKRVGYLDTDVGQPEFTAPGCLSLHIIDKPAPDLTILCLKTPERCFFYGDVNCQKDKNVYLNNILGLYDYFHNKYYQPTEIDNPGRNMLPLIVNTSGWVKGAGYDLLVEMLRYISPTHVVQIRVSAESKNLPRGVFWLDGDRNGSAKVIEICAAEKDPSRPVVNKKDASLLRDLRIIAYFRQCLPRELGIATYKELVESLGSIPAYGIPLSKLKIIQLHCQDSSAEVSHTLSATIVGLGISSCTPPSQENSKPWCVGLGFVRAIDVLKDLLCVVTPVPLRSVEKVDLILQSCLKVPACLLEVQRCASPCMPTIIQHELNGQEMDAKMAKIEREFSDLSAGCSSLLSGRRQGKKERPLREK